MARGLSPAKENSVIQQAKEADVIRTAKTRDERRKKNAALGEALSDQAKSMKHDGGLGTAGKVMTETAARIAKKRSRSA